MCVAINKGIFVPAFSEKISRLKKVPATLPVKNGSRVFSVNLK